MARGFTLLEVSVALTLAIFTVAAGLPVARASADRMAVVGARESLVGFLAHARAEALARGGASLWILADSGSVRLVAEEHALDSLSVQSRFGVDLDLGAGRTEAEVRFDALGIGRLANRTVTLRRGRAQTSLTLSAYGRVRRR